MRILELYKEINGIKTNSQAVVRIVEEYATLASEYEGILQERNAAVEELYRLHSIIQAKAASDKCFETISENLLKDNPVLSP